MKQERKLKCILDYYGKENQIIKTLEEFAELQELLTRTFTKAEPVSKANFASEIADVQIMLEQMKLAFNCKKEVDLWVDIKIARQFERMGNE